MFVINNLISTHFVSGLTLDGVKIYLASGSPRRRALLGELGLKFDVIKPEVDESVLPDEKPEELCERLAKIKAQAGIEIIKNSEINKIANKSKNENLLIIAADTIVVVKDKDNDKKKILGKPHDFNHAVEMLKLLQGREHEVLTGIAAALEYIDDKKIILKKIISGVERTSVKFRDLNDEQIKAYAKSGEGLDKAGAYAIQGRGALLVSGIHGDYFNVVGLPLCKLGKMLEELNFKLAEFLR